MSVNLFIPIFATVYKYFDMAILQTLFLIVFLVGVGIAFSLIYAMHVHSLKFHRDLKERKEMQRNLKEIVITVGHTPARPSAPAPEPTTPAPDTDVPDAPVWPMMQKERQEHAIKRQRVSGEERLRRKIMERKKNTIRFYSFILSLCLLSVLGFHFPVVIYLLLASIPFVVCFFVCREIRKDLKPDKAKG